MFKGISTLVEYEECIKKGLCEEHLKEVNQTEFAAVRDEFPKKAFKFVRVNVLYPFLCNKPPKCEKMKMLMEKTPHIAKVLLNAQAGYNMSEEDANVVLIVDSVVIFTICLLSKICCIGAIFHTKKKPTDPNIKAIQNILLFDRLNADIRYLYPYLLKNFTGYDLDVVRATHCITLFFIRKFCNKGSMKIAIEDIENDIQTNCDFNEIKIICNAYNVENVACAVQRTSHDSSLPFNFYNYEDYMIASNHFFSHGRFEMAKFFGYLAVTMDDVVGEPFHSYIKALLALKYFKEAHDVLKYGIKHCEKDSTLHKTLTKFSRNLVKCMASEQNETTNHVPGISLNHNDIKYKNLSKRKGKKPRNIRMATQECKRTLICKSGPVDLVDSDSGGSDSEANKSKSGPVDLVDSDSGGSESEANKDIELMLFAGAIDTDDSSELIVLIRDSSETMEKKELKSEKKIEFENKSPECVEDKVSDDVSDLAADTAYSNDEFEIKTKQQMVNGTKEKPKNKSYSRRKRTISEESTDNQPEDEMNISKINSYLKEASEALLADCGYKALQIFRGPLRKFIDSSNFLSFEECDTVCIKYSYGIAYCKSGGHDDLEKCITILKDIIENHDSITFPAAHYSLGLAFRKLNRFKEALNYLEIVQNFLDKGIHFKVYPWPGMTTVIQETKPDVLKNLVQDLIKECENPPIPDAFCRYENCNFQPTIYYTDPDFKGYMSLTCSEQCNLQYHLQCWKTIKEENNLTDKEFLEKSCFTPDCEGFISKIQSIDKKGDLSKEFSSEFKKPHKLPKKWDKKTDIKEKEKKRKKTVSRCDGGSQEHLSENARDCSRKNSICENEIMENKKDFSRESSISDKAKSRSGSCISNEEISPKSECSQNSSESLKQKTSTTNNCFSSFQENSYANHVEEFKEPSTSLQENKSNFELMECIKNNTYSYMEDFLQYHGPLRIDDPLLTNEIESFPDEIYYILSKIGGIGEFLKNDLRFAFVGDLYVCVIDHLAKAYQMLSNTTLPTDFKNLQTLENKEDSKYYSDSKKISYSKHSSFLNPDAQEYTPSNNKNNAYKFETNHSHEDLDSHCSLPLNLESSYAYQSSVSQLDTFSTTEVFVSKSKSCEAVSDKKFQDNTEHISSSISIEKNIVTDDSINKLYSETSNNKSVNNTIENSSNECVTLKYKKMEDQLLQILNQIFSEEMVEYHHSKIFLKPYIIKKIDQSVSESTMTEIKYPECKTFESSAVDQDNVIEGLKKEIYDLSKQNSSLQNVLECSTEQQQKLSAELTRLKKCLNESAIKIESLKKEFVKKEKDLLKEKVSLVQALSDANKFVGNVQQKNSSLAEEKLKLQKTVDNLTLQLRKEEEKMKSSLSLQENKFNATIEALHKENAELKNRTKHAELQVLYMKKTEYLKRIEAKSLEVDEVKKEMNTPSMQLWASAAGPEQMKILSTKLTNYVDEINTIKKDFTENIDEQIKKVKAGASLKDLKEIVMKDLAPVPTYKNTLPEHLFAGMSRFNSMTLPYFGTSAHISSAAIVPPVPAASSLLSSATSSLKITPPSATTTKIIPPISPVIPTKIIPPVAPAVTMKNVPASTNIIPPVTLSTAIIPPSASSITSTSHTSTSSSVPPVVSKNKDNKIDLANDIDPTIQESFKSAMASINSFASTPYSVPSLDEEFDKNCVVFKHPDPVSNDIKSDHPKVPPGLVNSVPCSASARASAISPISEPVVEACNASVKKSYADLDTVLKIKIPQTQSNWEPEKKKATASYPKLLSKLKEQFPTYSQEELISYVKEVRAQRQGKLSGLTIDAIISEISAIMKAKKKIPELKVQPKPAKVLVNKKLVPDPPKPPVEQQTTTKKKTAWNIDTDAAQKSFSGSADDDCTICCDTMINSAYKVACGHFFHEDCIRQWLKKNSNCPICRILLLLPEEYPSLS